MKVAYCDCFSGISGDMFIAALLDAGLPLDYLEQELTKLAIPEYYHLHHQKIQQGPIFASDFSVHGETHEIDPDTGHAHNHGHSHEGHAHEHSHDDHHHRGYLEISQLIENSGLKSAVKETAIHIFHTLAESEAKIHGTTVEEVHFHEVGALDSIIDIIGAAIGLDYLGIERLYASSLPYGEGQVHTQHGILPIPAPATLDLLTRANAPLRSIASDKELVTPTGAAILAALATFERPDMTLSVVGMGAGKRKMPWINFMRLIIGETKDTLGSTKLYDDLNPLVVMETNIDDMNPQVFGVLMEKLFANGALDVYSTPIYMKKNRPATQFSVIARKSHESLLAEIMLRESTTFGLRVYPIYRYEAERHFETVETPYGPIQVKVKTLDGKRILFQPEFDDVKRVAEENGVPFLEVWNSIQGKN
ncbi:MAG: nickel pincer cofactor biosynthesis protein LarC [Anaerolineae bacterium]|jgi:uncharacterized protein (TIGR00299 family) protein|nr:nickel pincer cofactor biosynthesis protein LarC [Anaerolineae bacterium]